MKIKLLLAALLLPVAALAADVQLAWDANVEPALVGYKVYYGNASRGAATKPSEFPYDGTVDVGNVTTFTVPGLSEANAWFFAVTAYGDQNAGILESAYSNEASIDFKILGNPANNRIIKVTIPNP